MNRIFLMLSLVSVIFYSCDKSEDAITPSENPAGEVVSIHTALNQGTKIYNDKIQDFYDNKKSVISYEFPFDLINYAGGDYDIEDVLNFTYAKEEYVGYLIDFYSQLSSSWGDSWSNSFFPRNIFMVDSLKVNGVDLSISSNNIRLVLAGAGKDKNDDFNSDKPYLDSGNMEELLKMTSTNAAKRNRVKLRYELFWKKFEDKFDDGTVAPPQEFVDMIDKEIDIDVFNSLTSAKQLDYVRSLGFFSLTMGKYGNIDDYYESEFEGTGYVQKNILLSGKIKSEEAREELISLEFCSVLKGYMGMLFKHGWTYTKNSAKMTSTPFYKYPKALKMIDVLLDKSVEYADVDLRKLLSEEYLSVPTDIK